MAFSPFVGFALDAHWYWYGHILLDNFSEFNC